MTDWKNTLKKAEELFDQGQLNEAERLGQSVLRVEPVNARAFQLLGLVCSERHDTKRAIEHLQTALRHCFNLAPSHNGLGLCYFALDQLDRALHHFNIAIEIEPGHARAHFNRSLVWLKRGQFQLGWPEYEWRFSTGLVAHPPIPRPRWEGSRLDGRSLLVFTEQGIGDVLQFIRFLRNISKDGGRIVLACQRALQPLLKHLPTVDSWFPIDEEAPIDFDCFIPLLSLPSLLEIDESTIPCNIPYLPVEHLQVEKWQSRLTRECNSEASNATDLRQ
ncbi:MAG: glycosyltransferase family protein, partial [Planctomycetales bacterium]|nr:glycosyltransferase family protein [Planctomycetales bacterium]